MSSSLLVFHGCSLNSHVFYVNVVLQSYGSRGHSRYGFSRESRDATLSNAKRVISQVSSLLERQ